MNCIFERRSIRKYESRPVESDKLERILRAGMQAPSAKNTQPWEFLVVTSAEGKEAIAGMSPYAKMTTSAPVAIMVLLSRDRIRPDNNRWEQDLSACTENMLLQITEEGLGGVWLGTYPDEERRKMLAGAFGLPEHVVPFSVIALGYPAEERPFVDRYDPSRVHYNRY